MQKHLLSEYIIINCLNSHYGIDVANLRYLALGADMNATVYKATARDQKSYFVKVKHDHHQDVSHDVQKLLLESGIRELIPPIKTLHGHTTQPCEDFSLIVYPFVEGQDGFARNLTENQWTKLGKALRQIHEIEVPSAIQKRIRKEIYSPKWREAVRALYVSIESAEIERDEIALKVLRYMNEHQPVIQRLVERSDQLAHKLQQHPQQCVLCHSDIHGGNVLIDENDNIYIVDWDDPIMAPKERDLMFIGGGVANVWNKYWEEELFYKGYGKTEVNKTILAFYRHERIVEDIAVYGEALLLSHRSGKEKPEMYKQFIAMFEPNGVVEIAFATDR